MLKKQEQTLRKQKRQSQQALTKKSEQQQNSDQLNEQNNDLFNSKQENQSQQQEKSQQNNEQNQQIKQQQQTEQEEIIMNPQLQPEDIEDKRKIYVILERCPLEVAKLKKKIVLLNSDDHKNYIVNKLKRDFSIYRPDIVHHSMLSLMDSPLNKAGHLQVFIHTEQGVLITISPNTKIPRTYQRFAALMAQLLIKLKIRAVQTSETLLKVIKNPVTNHLPENCIKIGTSCKARLVNLKDYAIKKLPKNAPIVFVVGGVAKGNPGMEIDYADDCICISKYSLSAGCCLSRITHTFEELWEIN